MTRIYYPGTHTLNPWELSNVDIKPKDIAGIKVVAISWGDTWAAYRGNTTWDDERIAYEGDVLLKELAERMFPAFAHSGLPYED
jgi:hypothetical protein